MHTLAAQWKSIPALRLLIPGAAGIWLQWEFQFPYLYPLLLLATCVLLFFASSLRPAYWKYKWGFLFGLLMNLIFLSVGALACHTADIRQHPHWLGRLPSQGAVLVRIAESPLPREKSWKCLASVMYTTNPEGQLQAAKGKLLLYFSKNDLDSLQLKKLVPGQWILLRRPPELIDPPANPGQFNYQRFCLFDGITHQAFLRNSDWQLLPRRELARFQVMLEGIRKKVLHTLRTYIPDARAAGLAEALLIGYKDDLDKNLLQQYADTGVVHIIAISGLHLGLIYWILRVFTRALPRRGRGRWMRFVLILSGLWLFSLLAGAQPSVVRSAVMFSFLLLGETTGRRAQTLNNLAASALLLLLYHPFWLWDIGFQLSYTAVLSLALYQQPIYRSWYIPQKWLDKLWQMNAVTLSAQVLTLPLCLYHFHQFPNYFLLANLVCVPLSSALLMAAIILCAAAPLPWLATWIGYGLHQGIRFMNVVVEWISRLPYALSSGIRLSELQVVLLYILLTAVCAALLWKKKWCWQLVPASLLFLSVYGYWQRQQEMQQHEWRVYALAGHTVSDFLYDGRYFILQQDTSGMGVLNYRFQLHGARVGLRKSEKLPPGYQIWPEALRLGQLKVLILREPWPVDSVTSVDLLWLQAGAGPPPRDSTIHFPIPAILADGSLPPAMVRRWRSFAKERKLKFHDIRTDGAFALRCR
jgi:competence protein ComEC